MPEVGHVRVMATDGQEFDFVPSLGAINSLGTGAEIVSTAADLFDRRPFVSLCAARCVLRACYAGDDDISPLIGHLTADAKDVAGSMSTTEMMAVARHLAQHGMAGKARPGGGRGGYATEFSIAQHVAAAVAHLGITRDAALSMTMTEMQMLIESKYPETKAKEVPTRDEYRQQLAAIMARRKAKVARV